ncbi:MAG TPA: hypothetical protein VMV15_01060 [Candidatus Binataceae bacterium]|nr:hypothetical protein [Candidatus Binataceae bacterium]
MTLFVPNLSQPPGEIIDVRGARESQNCFEVGDTVESIEGSREHLGGVGRSNQRIWLVGTSKQPAGDKVDSVGGGTVVIRFR